MSALSAIGKRIDALYGSLEVNAVKLAEYRSDESLTRNLLQNLLGLAKVVQADIFSLEGPLKAEIDKLVLKLDQKDPITGALRYGDTSKTKILSFVSRVEELIPKYASFHTELVTHIDSVQRKAADSGVDMNVPESVVDAKLSRLQAPALGPIRNIDSKFQNVSDQTAVDSPSTEMTAEERELEEQARRVRERKLQEAEHAKNVQDSLTRQLEGYITYFNSIRDFLLNRAAQKDVDNPLSVPILFLVQSNERNIVQEALKTVLGILERIISRPDDVAARRLRITHPILKQKLTGVLGGVELLMALGFQARVQRLDAVADPKVPPLPIASLEAILTAHRGRAFLSLESPDAPVTVFNSPDTNHAVNVFELLSPATLQELHLEMQEPSLDSLTSSTAQGSGKTDKLSWLDWFDSLGSYKSSIEEALGSL